MPSRYELPSFLMWHNSELITNQSYVSISHKLFFTWYPSQTSHPCYIAGKPGSDQMEMLLESDDNAPNERQDGFASADEPNVSHCIMLPCCGHQTLMFCQWELSFCMTMINHVDVCFVFPWVHQSWCGSRIPMQFLSIRFCIRRSSTWKTRTLLINAMIHGSKEYDTVIIHHLP